MTEGYKNEEHPLRIPFVTNPSSWHFYTRAKNPQMPQCTFKVSQNKLKLPNAFLKLHKIGAYELHKHSTNKSHQDMPNFKQEITGIRRGSPHKGSSLTSFEERQSGGGGECPVPRNSASSCQKTQKAWSRLRGFVCYEESARKACGGSQVKHTRDKFFFPLVSKLVDCALKRGKVNRIRQRELRRREQTEWDESSISGLFVLDIFRHHLQSTLVSQSCKLRILVKNSSTRLAWR